MDTGTGRRKIIYIVNWPWYEHRELPKRTPWAKDKADFEGDDWIAIMGHKHHAQAITTFKVLRDLALKSRYRGLVLTDGSNTKAHDLDSISEKSRCPRRTLERGIAVLTSVVRWIDVSDTDETFHDLSNRLWGRSYTAQGLTTETPRQERADSAEVPRQSPENSARHGEGERRKEKEREREKESAPRAEAPRGRETDSPSPSPASQGTTATATAYPADANPVEITIAERTAWGATPWEPVRNAALQLRQATAGTRAWTQADFLTKAGIAACPNQEAYIIAGVNKVANSETKPNNGRLLGCFRAWHFENMRNATEAARRAAWAEPPAQPSATATAPATPQETAPDRPASPAEVSQTMRRISETLKNGKGE